MGTQDALLTDPIRVVSVGIIIQEIPIPATIAGAVYHYRMNADVAGAVHYYCKNADITGVIHIDVRRLGVNEKNTAISGAVGATIITHGVKKNK